MKKRYRTIGFFSLTIILFATWYIYHSITNERIQLMSYYFRQAIQQVEFSAPREQYVVNGNSFYATNVDDPKQQKTFYDSVLEGVNGASNLPLTKISHVRISADGEEIHGFATVQFEVFGRVRTIHIDESANLLRFASLTSTDPLTTALQTWKTRIY